jgi:hypothetical protein
MYEGTAGASAAAGGALAFTGSSSLWLAIAAAGAILFGFVLMSLVSRRLRWRR